jgi:protein CpxP
MMTPATRKFGPAASRLLLALTFAACVAAPALAQDPSTPPPPPQQQGPPGGGRGGPEMQARQLDRLTKTLNLTPDQVTQVKAIQADTQQQMAAARQDSSTAGQDRRAKMTAIHQAEEGKIRALLNDDQKAKYDNMLATSRERQQQGGGQSAPPPPPPPPPSV